MIEMPTLEHDVIDIFWYWPDTFESLKFKNYGPKIFLKKKFRIFYLSILEKFENCDQIKILSILFIIWFLTKTKNLPQSDPK